MKKDIPIPTLLGALFATFAITMLFVWMILYAVSVFYPIDITVGKVAITTLGLLALRAVFK